MVQPPVQNVLKVILPKVAVVIARGTTANAEPVRTFLGWIVEGIELTIVPSALKDKDLHGATENVSGGRDLASRSRYRQDAPNLTLKA
mmetsp:Transcript_72817/g.115711  ORF Transcript_72817/g.115711 Transcript_72817/m.115711 type:complete len:88 (-) Transcript_72817:378-641(-)